MSEAVNTRASAALDALEIVRRAKPSDFDGHTEFHRLSPSQRLAWLDEAVAFVTAAKSTKRPPLLLLNISGSKPARVACQRKRA